MAIDTDRIDDAVLALLYLTLHDQDRASRVFDGDALGRLHAKGMIESSAGALETLTFTSDGLRRSKELFESMFSERGTEASASTARQAEQVARYPDVRVELADLGGQMFPILRRVSYAMSDAGIEDEVIERYKSAVKESDDPVGVSGRWVSVQA